MNVQSQLVNLFNIIKILEQINKKIIILLNKIVITLNDVFRLLDTI